MFTVSQAVANAVADHTTEVFALMGNGNAYFLDALAQRPGINITGLRHETGTVASADAYHRVARRIAVATTTYGPGFTNALTPLAEAVRSRTPLVFVAGGEPTSGPRAWDVDQTALVWATGAHAMTVSTQDPRAATYDAFRLAETERLPVVLFIPYDIATMPAANEAVTFPQPESSQWRVDPALLTQATSLLAEAKRPLILAGRGAREAAPGLSELADRLGALSATSAPARGTFGKRDYDLGVCGGFASEESSELIRQADVILAVGVGLNQFTTAFGHQFSSEATLIQVDLEPSKTDPRVDLYIQGAAESIAEILLEELSTPLSAITPWGGAAEAARGSRLNFKREPGTGQAEDGLLDPRTAMLRLNEILPSDRQVVTDGGHFIGWSSYYFDLPGPDRLVMVGTQFQSIGLGLPSAPGAVRARPDATTIVTVGDGGGIMGVPDLDSLVRTAKSAVVLVFNDACYGAEIHQYGSQGLNQSLMEIEQADFAKLAEGLGGAGVIVRTMDDLHIVHQWVNDGAHGTLVVDLRISRNVVAPYILEIVELTIKK